MPAVHLESVSFSYTSAVDVLSDVSLSLGPGWHGLMGENGAGKTTLLHLIRGELTPTSGRVTLGPADAVMAWCPQVVDRLEPEVESWAWSWESSDAALRARLELDPAQLSRWETLSPGERRRWQLAAAVAGQPDILGVDEPTNHLDTGAGEALEEELVRFRGVGIIVSHDRRLLDRLTSVTLRVVEGTVEEVRGSYTVASQEWERRRAEAEKERERLRAERDRTRRRLLDRRRGIDEQQARDRCRRREAGVSDPDARSIVVKGRQADGAAAHSRVAGIETRRLARLEEELRRSGAKGRRGGSIEIDGEAARKPVLLSHDGPVAVGGLVVHPAVTVHVERETRLRLSGPNGAGKTTLLRSLLADPPIPPERIMWLPQELSTSQRGELLQRIGRQSREDLGETMAMAARLGLDPERVLDSGLPSPGEARKLLVAEGLGRRVWVAVLDEPTNHFDLPSVERLQEALSVYEGALVVVSHDDYFAAPLVKEELELGGSALSGQ